LIKVIDQLSKENGQLDIKELITVLFGKDVDYKTIYERIKDTPS
jgi:hypothetical protein